MTDSGVWKAKVILLMVFAWPAFAFGSSLDADPILQVSPCANPISIQQQSIGIDIGLNAAIQEFLAPPSVAAQLTDKSAADIKNLPTVPAAFFMVLWGFICVIFVKDRRFLIVTLAAFWWAGQTGVNAIPKLISRIVQKNHRGLSSELSSDLYLENLFGSLSLNKESRYIGLLRSLNGIPDEKIVTIRFSDILKRKSNDFNSLQNDAVLVPQILSSVPKFFAKKFEQFTYFLPAFIFSNLARGPPAKQR
jgi:hypothetical protein